jgi:hypothetical protein
MLILSGRPSRISILEGKDLDRRVLLAQEEELSKQRSKREGFEH